MGLKELNNAVSEPPKKGRQEAELEELKNAMSGPPEKVQRVELTELNNEMSESPKNVGAAKVELKDLLMQMSVPSARKGGQRSDTLRMRLAGKTAAVGDKPVKRKPRVPKEKL